MKTNLPWGNPSCTSFFAQHRASLEEVYSSERYFIEKVVPQVQSLLDVGCASGGFYPILKKINPAIQYEGIDVVPRMIEQARMKYPGVPFQLADGATLPFEEGVKELVFCTGLFHLIDHYSAYLQELYRVASRYLLVDFRVHMESTYCSEMWVVFGEAQRKEELKVPYYVLNFGDYLQMLTSLKPSPEKIEIYGYPGRVSHNTKEDLKNVLFLFSNIHKGAGNGKFPEISFQVVSNP